MFARLCLAVLLPLSQALPTVTPEVCFEDMPRFEPVQENVKRIICPFLSSLINEEVLPKKKFYTRSELEAVTLAAANATQAAALPAASSYPGSTSQEMMFNIMGHINGNFQFNPSGLLDIFNMEGNPNEHDLSTGIHDCETLYPCYDEFGHGSCTHKPLVIGRFSDFPFPLQLQTPDSPAAMNHPPAYSNFCPDIVDHLPKCLRANTCNCIIPNKDKAKEFWDSLVNVSKQDDLVTKSDLDEIRKSFATQDAAFFSIDKNPVGSNALAGGFDFLNQIFGTSQADRNGTMEVGLNQAQFMELNIERKFPSTYTFPGGCFADPNQNVNQNNYTSVAAMEAAGWKNITQVDEPVPAFCKDAQNGQSKFTGTVFYGAAAEVSVRGSGVGYVDFGNCADVGIVYLIVDGEKVGEAYQSVVSQVVTFPYTTGQVIKIEALGGAIARVNFVAFDGTLVSNYTDEHEHCPTTTTTTTTPATTTTSLYSCLPDSTSSVAYTFAECRSNVCPAGTEPINSVSACQEAAAEMGEDRVGGEDRDADGLWDPKGQGWPSGCYKNMHNGNVHFNSFPTRSYQQISSWQKTDQRKICKIYGGRRLSQDVLI